MNEIEDQISKKVLFVDDEVLLLEGVKRQLRREFEVTTAEGGAQGLEILAEQGPFAVVVSDYNMPSMDGITFLNQVYQLYPHTVLIMLTGRAELDIAINALHNAHISRFINKPCPKEILVETLLDGLEQYRLRSSEQILKKHLQTANQQLQELNNHLELLVEQKTRALKLQYQYVADIARLSSSQHIVSAFVSAVTEITGLTEMSLWLSPHQDGYFECQYPDQGKKPSFKIDQCPDGQIRQAITIGQYWQAAPFATSLNDWEHSLFCAQPLLCLPLKTPKGTLGFLNLCGSTTINDQDIIQALVGMSDVTATALQSHWHREAFNDAQDAIISALAKLSEYRDSETGAHLLRLKKYCALICAALAKTDKFRDSITEDFTQDLVRSSPLHDIGKVGIPDAILKKPGKLTPEEFDIMKMHPMIGGDTLREIYEKYPSQSFIQCGMDVAYGHHERWDGSGYPRGLQGIAIPIAARIVALADVYDALTTRRIYKKAFTHEEAAKIITDGCGSHFDPDVVSAFTSHEQSFKVIAEELADEICELCETAPTD